MVTDERIQWLKEQYNKGNYVSLTNEEREAMDLEIPHPWNSSSVHARNVKKLTGRDLPSGANWQNVSGLVLTIGGCPIIGIPLLLWGIVRSARDD